MKFKTVMTSTILATAMAMPQMAMSDTAVDTGAGALSAAVDLDFRVVIPRFLRFRVGATGVTIDLIDFTVPAADVGSGLDIAGTGGTPGPGLVDVVVRSNAGQVTITESNDSGNLGLANGSGAFIPYTEILTVSNDPANLDAPTLSNAGGNTSLPVITGGSVTNRSAQWTYTYDNTTIYDAGTYGAAPGGGGGRVTYTASTL